MEFRARAASTLGLSGHSASDDSHLDGGQEVLQGGAGVRLEHERGKGLLFEIETVHHVICLRIALGQWWEGKSLFDESQERRKFVDRVALAPPENRPETRSADSARMLQDVPALNLLLDSALDSLAQAHLHQALMEGRDVAGILKSRREKPPVWRPAASCFAKSQEL
jgi:hypothetical protein